MSIEIENCRETPPKTVFDGFAYRPYNENYDGWIMTQKKPSFVVEMAYQIIDMHKEINELRREIWNLKQKEEILDSINKQFLGK